MSQGNVELVRRVFDAWNEGAFSDWISLHHPNVVVIPPEGWPEGQAPDSREAWASQAMRLMDSWEEQRLEVDDLREVGGRVLVLFRWITRGKDSGIEMETPMSVVAEVKDGMLGHLNYFVGHEEALEAVGLRK